MMRVSLMAFCMVFIWHGRCFASEPLEKIFVPFVVVDAGKRMEPDLVDAAARQLGSPVLRGSDLVPRLGRLFSIDVELKLVLDGLFVRALDNFFAGRHHEAETDFSEIVAFSESQPSAVLDSLLRKTVFKTHLYLAIIAKSRDHTTKVDKHLLDAMLFSSASEPEPAEFPPWLCERFSVVKRFREPAKRESTYRSLALNHSKIDFSQSDLVLVKDADASVNELAEDLLELTRTGKWPRLVAMIGSPESVEIWLVDGEADGVVRKARDLKIDRAAMEKAVGEIVFDPPGVDWKEKPSSRAMWYKNALAWSLAGAGVAALTAGIVLSQTLTMPASEEVWVWTLVAGGAGLLGTGTVMFFFPVEGSQRRGSSRKRDTAMGIVVGGSF